MAKPSLLIVDNEVHLTLLYEEELEDDGFDVDVANTDDEAFELLSMIAYDLLIVEPVTMNWRELNAVRNNLRRTRRTRVLFNTTNPKIAYLCGRGYFPDDCILKSSDISFLKEKIRKLLEPLALAEDTSRDKEYINA